MTGSRPTSRFECVSTEVADSCRNLHIANLCPSLGIIRFSADASCLFEVRSRSLGQPSPRIDDLGRLEKRYSATRRCP
jgi:hypothetical protein